MSLIVKLQNNEEEVPLEVFPDEDFKTVLQKASSLVGYDIHISCLTGEDNVSLSDNVYNYFMRDESLFAIQDNFENDPENVEFSQDFENKYVIDTDENSQNIDGAEETENMIKIIELSDNYPEEVASDSTVKLGTYIDQDVLNMINDSVINEGVDIYVVNDVDDPYSDDEEIDISNAIDLKVQSRITCTMCNGRLITMKDSVRNYMFKEKNHSLFRRSVENGLLLSASLVCTKCLKKKFTRRRKGTDDDLLSDEYIVVRKNMKLVFKKNIIDEPKNKHKRKETLSPKPDVSFEDILNYVKNRNNQMKSNTSYTDSKNANFLIRRKLGNEAASMNVVKRKLEMDGTISEITGDDVVKSDKKVKIQLTCRICGIEFLNSIEIINHASSHQTENCIPCGICPRNFKSVGVLKRHVYAEHDNSFIKTEPAPAKKEEVREESTEETNDEDLTDRLHKYLSGEMDAGTFFQQEYLQTDDNGQVLLNNDDYDDDDVIVCIVESENPEEDVNGGSDTQTDAVQDIAKLQDSEILENVQSLEGIDIVESNEQLEVIESTEEVHAYETSDNADHMAENIEATEVETFEEIDYFEDVEYDPNKDVDEDDDIDDNQRVNKKKWQPLPKYACNICNKRYSSEMRLDMHKCIDTSKSTEDKKEDTTCSICNETFLSKIRLQFHRQTHKEGGWQLMGCDQCDRKDFNSESELFDHVYYSHQKLLPCPYEGCTKSFKLKKLLKSHLRDHGMKKFECEKCGQRFQVQQTLKEHMVLHLKVKPFQCHICHKYMSKASRLRMHLLVHTSEQRPAFVLVCRYCDCAFKDALEAETHCDNPHECEPREEDKDGVFNEIFDDMDVYSIDELKSNWKKTKFPGVTDNDDDEGMEESLLNKHNLLMQLSDLARSSTSAVWIDKVYSCQYCEKAYYTKEALHQHRYQHSGVTHPYQCHLCEAKFLTYARCTAHKSTHGYFKEGGAPSLRDFPVIKHYLCDLCDKSNLLWTTVSVHYRHHHKHNSNHRNPPPCTTCYQQFAQSWELGKHRRIRHRKDVHEGSKAPNKVVNFSYQCLDCDQQFPSKSGLTNHRKVIHGAGDIELGRRNAKHGLLVCSECGKTYATKPALLTHIKWHTEHGITGDAARKRKRAYGKGSHICSSCGLGFYSAANLRAHIDRIHEKTFKYTCEECGKGHFTYMEMETHKLTHTGERPYKCPACPRAYVTKAILNKHFRNHTGERPYTCDVCDASFKTAHSRNYHRAKHTSGKLPSPFIVLEVKGGDSKALQAALHASMKAISGGKEKEGKAKSSKDSQNSMEYVKEEMDEYQQDVDEEEVLVSTSEVVEVENIVSMQEEGPDGVQIVYKKIVGSLNETGCENEYTIEYEEEIQ